MGKCDGSGDVTVDALVNMVNIALEQRPVSDCLALDKDSNGAVDIAEIIAGVNSALNDCPVSQP